MSTKDKVKSFYDWTADDFHPRISPKEGVAHFELEVESAAIDAWEDGRLRLDLSNVVVGGEADGKNGPRYTLSLGASAGKTKTGREFSVSEAEVAAQFANNVGKIMGGRKLSLSTPDSYDRTMLQEIADQIRGAHFIASVYRDDNDYDRIKRIWTLTDPPKGFTPPSQARKFSL